MAASDPFLVVDGINTFYGDSHVLYGLGLTMEKGRIVAILGRNGMGKTTLIRSIAGLTPPRSGDIRFCGKSLIGKAPHEVSKAGIAIVPQGRRIFASLTVRENLTVPTSKLAGHKVPPDGWNLERVLEEFPQLVDRLEYSGGSLSGGEQQMLAVGRSLMSNPDLILMDEPSEGLSPKLVGRVEEIMHKVRDRGHSILLVEQNLALALAVADYVYILSSGHFVAQGTPDELSKNPELLNRHLGVSEQE